MENYSKSLLPGVYHVVLGNYIKTSIVKLHIAQKTWHFDLFFANQFLLAQSEAVFDCNFPRVQMVHV